LIKDILPKLKPILICYIYHKNEKGKLSEKDLPLFIEWCHKKFRPDILIIYAS